MRAWVTDTGREQRPNDWDFRFNVTMQGSLSIGGDLSKYDKKVLEIHKKYIALYKEIRNTVQFGRFYRLANYEKDKFYATQYVDDEQSVVFLCKGANLFYNDNFIHFNLNGLDKDAKYEFDYEGKKVVYSGAYLMNVGLEFEIWHALQSRILVLKKVK
jgi:alpha-galactosidase